MIYDAASAAHVDPTVRFSNVPEAEAEAVPAADVAEASAPSLAEPLHTEDVFTDTPGAAATASKLTWHGGNELPEPSARLAAQRAQEEKTIARPKRSPLTSPPMEGPGTTWGLELEMAAKDPSLIWAKRTEVPGEAYEAMLQAVNRALGPDAGEITVHDVDGGHEASLVDAQGRTWKAVPEYLDTRYRKNGFELVCPPVTRDEVGLIQRVRAELAQDFVPGSRSSSHNTFEVSHLVKPNGNAKDLVRLILNLETHWPEIYTALGPERYGVTINRFGVPLAVNQRELLQELAALQNPKIDQVKAIFDKYEAREKELLPRSAKAPYKYRAVNYNKLFPADASAPRLLEFRICDLLSPEEIPATQRFLESLVMKGSSLRRTPGTFQSPFEGVNPDLKLSGDVQEENSDLAPVNAALQNISTRRYAGFLNRLGLDLADYPKAESLNDNPLRLSDAEAKKAMAQVPLWEPIKVKGGNLSFGFEIEYRMEDGQRLVAMPPDQGTWGHPVVNTEDFPFIDPSAHREGTGNMEVMSVPTEKLGEVFAQMRQMQRELGSNLRSFHFTVQVPNKQVEKIGLSELEGYLGRVADRAHAWRMNNRTSFFSLVPWSQIRPRPSALNQRGTLRAYDLHNGRYRIETRGYMSSANAIQDSVLRMVTALTQPSFLRGFTFEQEASTRAHPNALHDALAGIKGAPLSEEESARVDSMIRRDQGYEYMGDQMERGHVLPLLGFENAPYLTRAERVVVQNANREFLESAWRLLQRDNLTEKGLDTRLRKLTLNWVKKTGYEQILENSLLMRPKASVPFASPALLDRALQDEGLTGVVNWTSAVQRQGNLEALLGATRDESLGLLQQLYRDPAQDRLGRNDSPHVSPEAQQVLETELARRGLPATELTEA